MSTARILSMFVPRAARDVENLEEMRDIADDVVEADFVPYACLIDPLTLLTKNGEVMQILRVDRLDPMSDKAKTLRNAIRHAISTKLPDSSYAIWLHTFRREKAYLTKPAFACAHASALYDAWHETQGVSRGFTNELYLSIVKAGEPARMKDISGFIRSLSLSLDTSARMDYIDKAATELNKVVDGLLSVLKDFGGTRLGLETREDGAVYGEHLEFLEKLINLEARPMPLPTQDLSSYLTSGDVTFGFNAMEVRTAEGKRRFAAIMTVKEYKEASLAGIDEFLDIPCELIVTQNFDFINADKAKESYEKQAEYVRLSGDKDMWSWAEFAALMQEDTGERAFGRQQTSLFLIAPSIRQLEATVQMVRRAMTKLGIVCVREDLKLEEMYWAQLPANFTFVARAQPINTQHLAGFVKLQMPPKAALRPGIAPQPALVMRNAAGIATYNNLSFHDDTGVLKNHVALFGSAASGLHEYAHLMASMATATMPRLWYIDVSGRSKRTVESLGGTLQTPATAACPINPFALTDSATTREFLALWCAGLLDPRGVQTSTALMQFFHYTVSNVMALAPADRHLASFRAQLANEDAMLAKQFDPWVNAQNIVLSGHADALTLGNIGGFDIAHVMRDEASRCALTGYLLHRMTTTLDGTPTLLVLDEAAIILANQLFRGRIGAWLDYLTSKNTTVIALVNDVALSAQLGTLGALSEGCASKFYFASTESARELVTHTGLNEEDYFMLAEMNPNQRLALMVQNGTLDLLQTDTRSLPEEFRLVLANETIKSSSRNAADMLAELMGAPTQKASA